jgi:hypothetical protein
MPTTNSQERTRSRRSARAARAARSADSAARSRARANGRPADAAARAPPRRQQQRTEDTAEGATGTVHQIVDKAKPVLAGGAALAAVAGGVALARNGRGSKSFSLPSVGRKRRGAQLPHVNLPHVSLPHLPHRSDGERTDGLRATAKALGTVAVEVGKAGYRAGELASEVRRVREQVAHKDD